MPVKNAIAAKESAFKCFFPDVKRYFDFKDAAVRSVDPVRGEFAGELLVTLTPRLAKGHAFGGRFETDERLLVTAMIDVEVPATPRRTA